METHSLLLSSVGMCAHGSQFMGGTLPSCTHLQGSGLLPVQAAPDQTHHHPGHWCSLYCCVPLPARHTVLWWHYLGLVQTQGSVRMCVHTISDIVFDTLQTKRAAAACSTAWQWQASPRHAEAVQCSAL